MNREDRIKLLAGSLNEATHKAEREREDKLQVERITRDVHAHLAATLKAESGREVTCPHCNEKFTVGYRTDDVTSDTQNNDEVNEQDESGPASAPAYDNRRPIKPLSGAARARIMASFNKIR